MQTKTMKDLMARFNPPAGPLEPHHPHTLIVTCIDSRLNPLKMFRLSENEALVHRPIAAVIPPYDEQIRRREMEAILSFGVQIKGVQKDREAEGGIRNIIIMAHSNCGGATLASLPRTDAQCGAQPVQVVRGFVKETGLSLAFLRDKFGGAADPDVLARLIGIQSYHNLTTYPPIEEKIKEGSLDIVLTYYDMAEKTLSIFDLATEEWRPREEMLDRKHFCHKAACPTCSCEDRFARAVENNLNL